MHPVRRADGELCGFVAFERGHWLALTVFGAVLSTHEREDEAERHVVEHGLAALAERWTLVDGESGAEQIVCIQHASPEEVSLALGYYSMPGVETVTIPAAALAAGRWRLERRTRRLAQGRTISCSSARKMGERARSMKRASSSRSARAAASASSPLTVRASGPSNQSSATPS